MNLLKIPLIFTLVTSPVWAADSNKPKVSLEEMDTYLEAIKDNDVEKQLLNSDYFKTCNAEYAKAEKTGADGKQAVQNCMTDVFQNLKPDQLKEIASNFDLKAYNKKAATSAESILEFLQKRLRKALYGVDLAREKKKLKEQNFVNHAAFYQLYKEQIGKNTLLEISRYCLEHFTPDGEPSSFLLVKAGQDENFLINKVSILNSGALDGLSETAVLIDPKTGANQFDQYLSATFKEDNLLKQQYNQMSPIPNQFFKDAKELPVCTLKTIKECKDRFKGDKKSFKTIALLETLKNAEFKAAKVLGSKVIGDRYKYCASNIISSMCEKFKCKNVYSDASTDNQKTRCSKDFDIDVGKNQSIATDDILDETVDKNGQIACNLMNRLQEFRLVLQETTNIQNENKNFGVRSGLTIGEQFKDIFEGGNKVDQLTSIASKQLVAGAETFNNEELVENLKEICMESRPFGPNNEEKYVLKDDAVQNEQCAPLITSINKEKFDQVELKTLGEYEVETKEKLQRDVQKLIGNKEELERFKKKYELAGDPTPEQIEQLLKDEATLKKKALIAGLREKYKLDKDIKEKDLVDGSATEAEKLLAQQKLADIEQHKKRVETLFEYSNIVSSYLSVKTKDGEGKVVSERENATSRNIELSENPEVLQEYFQGDSESGESKETSSGGIDYADVIDAVLGVKKDDPTQTN